MNWFALTVKPKHERTVESQLFAKTIESYAPFYLARRTWSDRIKAVEVPLFSGYVFCRFQFPDRLRVLQTPSITSIVSFCGEPAVIKDDEIAAIRALVTSRLPLLPGPSIQLGQRVRICLGPLRGLEGILAQHRNSFRVVVNVEMLNRSVSAEVARADIERIH